MFLTAVVQVDLTTATLSVPAAGMKVPAVVGRPESPTPEGIYLVRRAHSVMLKQDILVFMKDGHEVWAIHQNLRSRDVALNSPQPLIRNLSAGCIGVSHRAFRKLWELPQREIVLQVYRSKP